MVDTPTYARHQRCCRGGAAIGIAVLGTALALPIPAAAQQSRPVVLRVTVDHATVLTLAAAPAVVLIADPQVADIVDERNNLMFVLGRKPGATNLLAFDGSGRRLLDREIVVVPENANTVTVTRANDQTEYICAPRCAFRAHVPTQARTPSEIGIASEGATGAAPVGARPGPPGR